GVAVAEREPPAERRGGGAGRTLDKDALVVERIGASVSRDADGEPAGQRGGDPRAAPGDRLVDDLDLRPRKLEAQPDAVAKLPDPVVRGLRGRQVDPAVHSE